jgi:L-cysteine/cystine lyase
VDVAALRGEFPVLDRFAYLNAGTDGPLPARAVQAARAELERELSDGRWRAHFERRFALGTALRDRYARAMSCDPLDLAITTSTSEGLAQVIAGIELSRGQEILTSDEEHPGLLGTLGGARDTRGVTVRVVPFAELANEVGSNTALVACSHVSWITGATAPAELAQVDVPVVFDGAQGLGAVPIDVSGCDAYAGAGQKWLCGPDGTGALYISPELRRSISIPRRGYLNVAHGAPGEGPSALDAPLHDNARSLDTMALSAEAMACAVAALDVLEQVGWPALHAAALARADQLAQLLADAGREIAPRGRTTLVSFASADPDADLASLAEAGVILRNLPGHRWLRASVGAWNDERDFERLLGALL